MARAPPLTVPDGMSESAECIMANKRGSPSVGTIILAVVLLVLAVLIVWFALDFGLATRNP